MSSASIQTLPEELLREILSYIFHLSPESFCGSRTRWHSLAQPVPYYQRRSTCQDLILVCKSWLRIATPLLYESLAVRTPEHVATVATLLKATPSLGRAVKQLKVFGGYGKDMGILASTCPNVDTLYVYVSVKSDASIVGIKKVLLALSPTRLYLEEYRAYSNKKVDELHQLIGTQFTKWAHLRELYYSPSTGSPATLDAINASPSLRDVWIDANALKITLINDPQRVLALLQDPSAMQTLHCLKGIPADAEDMRTLMEKMRCPKTVVDRVVFEEYPERPDGLFEDDFLVEFWGPSFVEITSMV